MNSCSTTTPLRLRSSRFRTVIRSCMDSCRPASIRKRFSYWQLMNPFCSRFIWLNRYFDSCFLNSPRIFRMVSSLSMHSYRICRTMCSSYSPSRGGPREAYLSYARTISQNSEKESQGSSLWANLAMTVQKSSGEQLSLPPALMQQWQKSSALATPLWLRSIILKSLRQSTLCCASRSLSSSMSRAVGRKTWMNLISKSWGVIGFFMAGLIFYGWGFSLAIWRQADQSYNFLPFAGSFAYRLVVRFITGVLTLTFCRPVGRFLRLYFKFSVFASSDCSSSLYSFSLNSLLNYDGPSTTNAFRIQP